MFPLFFFKVQLTIYIILAIQEVTSSPMDNNQALKQQCDNCHKMIDSQKIATHFSYCRRNFKTCQECHQMYDINYKQDHIEQAHKVVLCNECKRNFKKSQIEEHKKQCGPRLLLCPYCDLKVPEHNYHNHQKACGGRTVQCDVCHKYVPTSSLAQHEIICFSQLVDCDKQKGQGKQGQEGTKRKPRSAAVDIFRRPTPAPAPKMPIRSRNKQKQPIDVEQQIEKKNTQRILNRLPATKQEQTNKQQKKPKTQTLTDLITQTKKQSVIIVKPQLKNTAQDKKAEQKQKEIVISDESKSEAENENEKVNIIEGSGNNSNSSGGVSGNGSSISGHAELISQMEEISYNQDSDHQD